MTDEASGNLMARWQQGDQQAAAQLFGRYADRLVALARSRLPASLAGRIDAEEVVQSVYRCFFAGAREGRYDLNRGGDLWRLLVTITLHKVFYQVRRHSARKRAIGLEQMQTGKAGEADDQAELLAREPSPLEVAALADLVAQLMRQLEPLPRRMLELRLQGCKLEEIAAATDRTERTVRRVLEEVKQQLVQWCPDP